MKLDCVRTLLFVLALLTLGLVGSAAVVLGIRSIIVVWQSHEWLPAPAVITDAWVTKVNARRGYSYCPNWRYKYTANNVTYQSELIAYGISRCFNTEAEAIHALKGYPKGGKTEAHYNPTRQSEAVLKVFNSGWWVYIVATIAGSLASVLGFWNAARLSKAQC